MSSWIQTAPREGVQLWVRELPLFSLSLFFFFFFFLGLYPWHMEAPKVGVESELHLLACATATATATQDPSHVYDLYHSSCQCQTLNPLSKARDHTCILMDTSHIVSTEPQWELLRELLLDTEKTAPVEGHGCEWSAVAPLAVMGRRALEIYIFYFFIFLGPHLRHMEVPRIRVELD